MKKMSVFALLAALAMVLVAPAAFANEHPPGGPPSNMIVAAQSALEKANPDFQLASVPSTAMLAANGCNTCHKDKTLGTTAPAAMQDTLGTHLGLALTGPLSAAGAQQQINDKLILSGTAEGTKKTGLVAVAPYTDVGLMASGSGTHTKGVFYTDIGSARFTAAAPTPKASLILGMTSGSGTMDAAAQLTAAMKTATHYGLARAPDTPSHQLGGAGAPYSSGPLLVNDSAGDQGGQDLDREV